MANTDNAQQRLDNLIAKLWEHLEQQPPPNFSKLSTTEQDHRLLAAIEAAIRDTRWYILARDRNPVSDGYYLCKSYQSVRPELRAFTVNRSDPTTGFWDTNGDPVFAWKRMGV